MGTEVSSEYLYHFTPELGSIINILKVGFKPFYCLERLDYINLTESSGSKFKMAFPMVCFCDLSEDKQAKHKSKFGEYSISLFKSWGVRNLITPVTYCSERTLSSISLKSLFDHYKDNVEKFSEFEQNRYKNAWSLQLMHYKDYEGYAYKKEAKLFENETTRFYDEREWRYIPLKIDGLEYNLNQTEFEDITIRNLKNKKIQEMNTLQFSLNDIKNIHITSFEEIFILQKELASIYSDEEMKEIKQKIRISNKIKIVSHIRLRLLKLGLYFKK